MTFLNKVLMCIKLAHWAINTTKYHKYNTIVLVDCIDVKHVVARFTDCYCNQTKQLIINRHSKPFFITPHSIT